MPTLSSGSTHTAQRWKEKAGLENQSSESKLKQISFRLLSAKTREALTHPARNPHSQTGAFIHSSSSSRFACRIMRMMCLWVVCTSCVDQRTRGGLQPHPGSYLSLLTQRLFFLMWTSGITLWVHSADWLSADSSASKLPFNVTCEWEWEGREPTGPRRARSQSAEWGIRRKHQIDQLCRYTRLKRNDSLLYFKCLRLTGKYNQIIFLRATQRNNKQKPVCNLTTRTIRWSVVIPRSYHESRACLVM